MGETRVILPSVGESPTGGVTIPASIRNDATLSRWYVDLVDVLRALRQAEPGIINQAAVEASPYIIKAIRNNLAPDIIEKILDILILKFRDVPPGMNLEMVVDYLIDKIATARDTTTRSLNYQLLLGIKGKHLPEIGLPMMQRIDQTILEYMDEVSPEAAAMAQQWLPQAGEQISLTVPDVPVGKKNILLPAAGIILVGLAIFLTFGGKK